MFVENNTIQAFKTYFFKRLNPIYEEGEVNQLFYLTFFYFKGWDRITLRMNEKEKLSESELLKLNLIIKRLVISEPIQHIFGETNFYGLDFKVSKDVLIPRQETEELVDLIIANSYKKPIHLLDVGTGSGCIPLSIAINAPNIKVSAIDVSKEALIIAKENASLHNVNLDLYEIDVLNLDSISSKIPAQVDVIVSNPPYITMDEQQLMHKNVLDFDPHLALFVENNTPLIFYIKITQLAEEKLKEGGELYFEINENFGEETVNLVKEYQFKNVELIKDLNGKDRIVKAIKK